MRLVDFLDIAGLVLLIAGFVLLIVGFGLSIVRYFAERKGQQAGQRSAERGEGNREAGTEEFALGFKWIEDDIVSIMRKRFLRSTGLKLIVFVGTLALPLLTGEVIALSLRSQAAKEAIWIGWGALVVVCLIFIGVPVAVYIFAIPLGFRSSPIWRYEVRFHFCLDRLQITLIDAPEEVFELKWRSIREVMQDERAYSLQYGPEPRDFLIVPKRVFETRQQVEFFESALKSAGTKWA